MGDLNSKVNRAVWFDIPVVDLGRAILFYKAVLGIEVFEETFGDFRFAVLDHKDGNGGCLVVQPNEISQQGILLYLNVDGRIRDAVAQVPLAGGVVVQEVHEIGPHGYRAIVHDSEGNRIALHSNSNA